jgi:hypothetical protein
MSQSKFVMSRRANRVERNPAAEEFGINESEMTSAPYALSAIEMRRDESSRCKVSMDAIRIVPRGKQRPKGMLGGGRGVKIRQAPSASSGLQLTAQPYIADVAREI